MYFTQYSSLDGFYPFMSENSSVFQCDFSNQFIIFIYHRKYGNISFFHFPNQNFRSFFTQTSDCRTSYHNASCRDNLTSVYIFNKTCYIIISRFSQDFFRSSHLHYFPILHDSNTVSQFNGFIQIVSNKNNRFFHLRLYG